MIDFRQPRRSDLLYVAKRMAEIDRRECAAFGRRPLDALSLGIIASAQAWTATVDGKPLAVFGVTPISTLEGRGGPWMLCVDEARRHRVAFLRDAAPFIQQMQAMFPRLENHVHQENVAAIRWLRKLGFTVEAEPLYARGEPMLPFWRGRADV